MELLTPLGGLLRGVVESFGDGVVSLISAALERRRWDPEKLFEAWAALGGAAAQPVHGSASRCRGSASNVGCQGSTGRPGQVS